MFDESEVKELIHSVVAAIGTRRAASKSITIDGCPFTFATFDGRYYDVWADDGRTTLYSYNPNMSDETHEQIELKSFEVVKYYLQGMICCSDCGKLIKKSDVAGGYFAGRYCTDCWNRKWKAIEARETYD